MDLASILAEFHAIGDIFLRSDKQLATATFCERAGKALDKVVEEAGGIDFDHSVVGIWIIIRSFNDLLPQLVDCPLLTQFVDKLFQQCARVVLDIKWQQQGEATQSRHNFQVSLSKCHQQMAPRGFTGFSMLQTLMEKPWTDPVLTMVMGSEEDNEEGEGLAYILSQNPAILKLRVELMQQENCDEFALNLCTWCLKHPALAQDFGLRKTQFVLLHRLSYIDRLQEECQAMSMEDSIRMINWLQKKEEHKDLCTMLAQTFLVQNWIKPSDNATKKELLQLWIRLQYQADEDRDRFISSLWAVAKVSHSTEQLLFIIDAVREQCGDTFLQFYLDLCVFAINVDKGCWEKLKESNSTGPNEELQARKRDIAQVCDKLVHIVAHVSSKISFCCALTAFSLVPSDKSLQAVYDAHVRRSHSGHSSKSQCCSNCAADQGGCLKNGDVDKSSRDVNVATLYEVERLCGMLRPAYLSSDTDIAVLLSLCKQYLLKEKVAASKSSLVHPAQQSPALQPSVDTSWSSATMAGHSSLNSRPNILRGLGAGSKAGEASLHVGEVGGAQSATALGKDGNGVPVPGMQQGVQQASTVGPATQSGTQDAGHNPVQQLVLKQLSSDMVQTLLHLIESGQISAVHLNQVLTKTPNMSLLQNLVTQAKQTQEGKERSSQQQHSSQQQMVHKQQQPNQQQIAPRQQHPSQQHIAPRQQQPNQQQQQQVYLPVQVQQIQQQHQQSQQTLQEPSKTLQVQQPGLQQSFQKDEAIASGQPSYHRPPYSVLSSIPVQPRIVVQNACVQQQTPPMTITQTVPILQQSVSVRPRPLAHSSVQTGPLALSSVQTGPLAHSTAQGQPVRPSSLAHSSVQVQQNQMLRAVRPVAPLLPNMSTLRLSTTASMQVTQPIHVMTFRHTAPMLSSAAGTHSSQVVMPNSRVLTHLSGGSVKSVQQLPLAVASTTLASQMAIATSKVSPQLMAKVPGQSVAVDATTNHVNVASHDPAVASHDPAAISDNDLGNRHYSINNLLFTGEQQNSALSISLPDKLPEISVDSISDTLRALGDAPGGQLIPKVPAQQGTMLSTPATSQATQKLSIPLEVLNSSQSWQKKSSTKPAKQSKSKKVSVKSSSGQDKVAAQPSAPVSQHSLLASLPSLPMPGTASMDCQAQPLPSFSSLFSSTPSPLPLPSLLSQPPAAVSAPAPLPSANRGVAGRGETGGDKGGKQNKTKEEMMQLLERAMSINVGRQADTVGAARVSKSLASTALATSQGPALNQVLAGDFLSSSSVSTSSMSQRGQAAASFVPLAPPVPSYTALSSLSTAAYGTSGTSTVSESVNKHWKRDNAVTCKQSTVPEVASCGASSVRSMSSAVSTSRLSTMLVEGTPVCGASDRFVYGAAFNTALMPAASRVGDGQATGNADTAGNDLVDRQGPAVCYSSEDAASQLTPVDPQSIVSTDITSSSTLSLTDSSRGTVHNSAMSVDGAMDAASNQVMQQPGSNELEVTNTSGEIEIVNKNGEHSFATYRCIICAKPFMTLDALRLHVKRICKPDGQSGCPEGSGDLANVHPSVVGLETSTVFQCMRCFELCISESGIRAHRQICAKEPKPKPKPKSKAKPKPPKSEEEQATEARVMELLNKCLGENREKLLEEFQAQKDKKSGSKKKAARKRKVENGDPAPANEATKAKKPKKAKKETDAKQSDTQNVTVTSSAISQQAQTVSELLEAEVSQSKGRKSLEGLIQTDSDRKTAVSLESSATAESAESTLASTIPATIAVASDANLSQGAEEKSKGKRKYYPKKKKAPAEEVDASGSKQAFGNTMKTESGVLPKMDQGNEPDSGVNDTKKAKTQGQQPRFKKLSGSGGRNFFKCLNCGQTLCSIESFHDHWQECIIKKPPAKPKPPAKEKKTKTSSMGSNKTNSCVYSSLESIDATIARVAAGLFDSDVSNFEQTWNPIEGSKEMTDVNYPNDLLTDSKIQPSDESQVSNSSSAAKPCELEDKPFAGTVLRSDSAFAQTADTCKDGSSDVVSEHTVTTAPVSEVLLTDLPVTLDAEKTEPSTMGGKKQKAGGAEKGKKKISSGTGRSPVSKAAGQEEPEGKKADGAADEGGTKYCQLCQRTFSRHWVLLRHFAGQHIKPIKRQTENGITFTCPFCPESFSDYANYKMHVMCHSDIIIDKLNVKQPSQSASSAVMTVKEDTTVKENGVAKPTVVDSGNALAEDELGATVHKDEPATQQPQTLWGQATLSEKVTVPELATALEILTELAASSENIAVPSQEVVTESIGVGVEVGVSDIALDPHGQTQQLGIDMTALGIQGRPGQQDGSQNVSLCIPYTINAQQEEIESENIAVIKEDCVLKTEKVLDNVVTGTRDKQGSVAVSDKNILPENVVLVESKMGSEKGDLLKHTAVVGLSPVTEVSGHNTYQQLLIEETKSNQSPESFLSGSMAKSSHETEDKKHMQTIKDEAVPKPPKKSKAKKGKRDTDRKQEVGVSQSVGEADTGENKTIKDSPGEEVSNKTEGKEPNKYCRLCDRFFCRRCVLIQHIATQHLDIFTKKKTDKVNCSYLCHLCHKVFPRYNKYTLHVPSHAKIIFEKFNALKFTEAVDQNEYFAQKTCELDGDEKTPETETASSKPVSEMDSKTVPGQALEKVMVTEKVHDNDEFIDTKEKATSEILTDGSETVGTIDKPSYVAVEGKNERPCNLPETEGVIEKAGDVALDAKNESSCDAPVTVGVAEKAGCLAGEGKNGSLCDMPERAGVIEKAGDVAIEAKNESPCDVAEKAVVNEIVSVATIQAKTEDMICMSEAGVSSLSCVEREVEAKNTNRSDVSEKTSLREKASPAADEEKVEKACDLTPSSERKRSRSRENTSKSPRRVSARCGNRETEKRPERVNKVSKSETPSKLRQKDVKKDALKTPTSPIKDENKYCKRCKRYFCRHWVLAQHICSQHTHPFTQKKVGDKTTFTCHLCNKTFMQYSHYMAHIPSHALEVIEKYNHCDSSDKLNSSGQSPISVLQKDSFEGKVQKDAESKEQKECRKLRSKKTAVAASSILAAKRKAISSQALNRRPGRAARSQAMRRIMVSRLPATQSNSKTHDSDQTRKRKAAAAAAEPESVLSQHGQQLPRKESLAKKKFKSDKEPESKRETSTGGTDRMKTRSEVSARLVAKSGKKETNSEQVSSDGEHRQTRADSCKKEGLKGDLDGPADCTAASLPNGKKQQKGGAEGENRPVTRFRTLPANDRVEQEKSEKVWSGDDQKQAPTAEQEYCIDEISTRLRKQRRMEASAEDDTGTHNSEKANFGETFVDDSAIPEKYDLTKPDTPMCSALAGTVSNATQSSVSSVGHGSCNVSRPLAANKATLSFTDAFVAFVRDRSEEAKHPDCGSGEGVAAKGGTVPGASATMSGEEVDDDADMSSTLPEKREKLTRQCKTKHCEHPGNTADASEASCDNGDENVKECSVSLGPKVDCTDVASGKAEECHSACDNKDGDSCVECESGQTAAHHSADKSLLQNTVSQSVADMLRGKSGACLEGHPQGSLNGRTELTHSDSEGQSKDFEMSEESTAVTMVSLNSAADNGGQTRSHITEPGVSATAQSVDSVTTSVGSCVAGQASSHSPQQRTACEETSCVKLADSSACPQEGKGVSGAETEVKHWPSKQVLAADTERLEEDSDACASNSQLSSITCQSTEKMGLRYATSVEPSVCNSEGEQPALHGTVCAEPQLASGNNIQTCHSVNHQIPALRARDRMGMFYDSTYRQSADTSKNKTSPVHTPVAMNHHSLETGEDVQATSISQNGGVTSEDDGDACEDEIPLVAIPDSLRSCMSSEEQACDATERNSLVNVDLDMKSVTITPTDKGSEKPVVTSPVYPTAESSAAWCQSEAVAASTPEHCEELTHKPSEGLSAAGCESEALEQCKESKDKPSRGLCHSPHLPFSKNACYQGEVTSCSLVENLSESDVDLPDLCIEADPQSTVRSLEKPWLRRQLGSQDEGSRTCGKEGKLAPTARTRHSSLPSAHHFSRKGKADPAQLEKNDSSLVKADNPDSTLPADTKQHSDNTEQNRPVRQKKSDVCRTYCVKLREKKATNAVAKDQEADSPESLAKKPLPTLKSLRNIHQPEPFIWDAEGEEHQRKAARNERSLKAFKQKVDVAPFSWDCEEVDGRKEKSREVRGVMGNRETLLNHQHHVDSLPVSLLAEQRPGKWGWEQSDHSSKPCQDRDSYKPCDSIQATSEADGKASCISSKFDNTLHHNKSTENTGSSLEKDSDQSLKVGSQMDEVSVNDDGCSAANTSQCQLHDIDIRGQSESPQTRLATTFTSVMSSAASNQNVEKMSTRSTSRNKRTSKSLRGRPFTKSRSYDSESSHRENQSSRQTRVPPSAVIEPDANLPSEPIRNSEDKVGSGQSAGSPSLSTAVHSASQSPSRGRQRHGVSDVKIKSSGHKGASSENQRRPGRVNRITRFGGSRRKFSTSERVSVSASERVSVSASERVSVSASERVSVSASDANRSSIDTADSETLMNKRTRRSKNSAERDTTKNEKQGSEGSVLDSKHQQDPICSAGVSGSAISLRSRDGIQNKKEVQHGSIVKSDHGGERSKLSLFEYGSASSDCTADCRPVGNPDGSQDKIGPQASHGNCPSKLTQNKDSGVGSSSSVSVVKDAGSDGLEDGPQTSSKSGLCGQIDVKQGGTKGSTAGDALKPVITDTKVGVLSGKSNPHKEDKDSGMKSELAITSVIQPAGPSQRRQTSRNLTVNKPLLGDTSVINNDTASCSTVDKNVIVSSSGELARAALGTESLSKGPSEKEARSASRPQRSSSREQKPANLPPETKTSKKVPQPELAVSSPKSEGVVLSNQKVATGANTNRARSSQCKPKNKQSKLSQPSLEAMVRRRRPPANWGKAVTSPGPKRPLLTSPAPQYEIIRVEPRVEDSAADLRRTRSSDKELETCSRTVHTRISVNKSKPSFHNPQSRNKATDQKWSIDRQHTHSDVRKRRADTRFPFHFKRARKGPDTK